MAKRPRSNTVERRMVNALDQLSAFEEFQSEIAPALRAAVKAGKSPEEIYDMALAAAAARLVTIGLTSKKPNEALPALKDILDRAKGKAIEKREVKLELERASDEDLDIKLKALMGQEDTDSEETIQ